MNWNVFTQIPEARVNVSLFGDAHSQGVHTGNQLPTQTTAAIRGLQEGIDKGIDTVGKIERNRGQQLQNETMEARLPYAGQIEQERLDALVLGNRESRNRLEQEELLEKEKYNTKRSELLTSEVEANSKRRQLQREREYLDQFQNATPEQQAQMVSGGQYTDMFSVNPKLREDSVKAIITNLDTPEHIRSNLQNTIQNTKQQEQIAQKASKLITDSESYMQVSPAYKEAAAKLGISADQMANRVDLVPSDQFELTSDGTEFELDAQGNRLKREDFDYATSTLKNNYLIVDKATGEILSLRGTKEDFDAKVDYITGQNDLRRLQQSRQVQQPGQPQQGQQQVQQQRQRQPQASASTAVNVPKEAAILQEQLGLNVADLEQLKPTLRGVMDVSNRLITATDSYDTIALAEEETEYVDQISRYMVQKEWRSNPNLQTQYTDELVKKENDYLRKTLTAQNSAYFSEEDLEVFIEPMLVSSPEELYYRQRARAVNRNVASALGNMKVYLAGKTNAEYNRIDGVSRADSFLSGDSAQNSSIRSTNRLPVLTPNTPEYPRPSTYQQSSPSPSPTPSPATNIENTPRPSKVAPSVTTSVQPRPSPSPTPVPEPNSIPVPGGVAPNAA